jgi:hypothetical protein
VVGPNGKKSAVLEDMAVWEQIVRMLEDVEDVDEIKQARTIREEQVPCSVTKKDLKLDK